MGHAINSLPTGVKNVQKNPVIVAYSYLLMLGTFVVSLPLLLFAGLLAIVPILGLLAWPITAIPIQTLLLGGMVGVAGAGFTGSVGLEDLTDTYREHGLSLAGAFAIQQLVLLVFSIVVSIVFVVVALGGALSADAIQSEMATTGFGVLFVAMYVGLVLLIVAITAFFQFLDVAVVLGEESATGAVKECWRLVRNGPLSVLGYTVLRGVVGVVVLLPGYIILFAGSQVSDVLTWVGAGVLLLLYPVAFAVLMSYHAAYYGHRIRAR